MPVAPDALPRCPPHLTDVARKEWRRIAKPLYDMGVLSVTDRAALAAYCQAWARWVEAEEHLANGPPLIKTPSGYVQQSPWLTVANKQLDIMSRFMAELGLSPSARARLRIPGGATGDERLDVVRVIIGGPSELDAESWQRKYCDDGNGTEPEDGVIVLPPNADRV